jgi:hypothetical protein
MRGRCGRVDFFGCSYVKYSRKLAHEQYTASTHASRKLTNHEEARDCIHYIWTNRRRMCYPKFHQQGFCTSTGVVEAGCKVVIGTRLKRAGMHWTVRGANAIIALRCSKLSGRFKDFWARRSDRMNPAA